MSNLVIPCPEPDHPENNPRPSKIDMISIIREWTGLGLAEAKALVEKDYTMLEIQLRRRRDHP